MKSHYNLHCFLPLVLCLALLGLTACGSAAPAPAAPAAPAATAAPQPTEAPTPEPTAVPAVTIDGSTITLRDDGTGEDSQDADMAKRVILTTRGIDYTVTNGPIVFTVESLQVAEFTVHNQAIADFMGVEVDNPFTLIGIQLSAENTTEEDIYFNPNMSTIVTSDKEQVTADLWNSDDVGGEYMGQVLKTGQVFFYCTRTDPDALSHITWRIDPAHSASDPLGGDPIRIDFELVTD